jgi:hypothetical protein
VASVWFLSHLAGIFPVMVLGVDPIKTTALARSRLMKHRHECSIARFRQLRNRNKTERRGIDAIAPPGRRRSIVEYMAEMGIAGFAAHFGPYCPTFRSSCSMIFSACTGLVKLGQPVPVPESNLATELNNGSPETISTYI